MLEVSQVANQNIKSIMADKSLSGAVRIFAQQGCGGAQLALGTDEVRDNDAQVDVDGVTYVIDKDLSEAVGAVSLGFVEDGAQPGFTISSEKPLVMEGGCSCGGGSCSC